MKKIKHHIELISEYLREFQHCGTVCSTSRWAASALIEPLKEARPPRKILEVGAGTGPVTVQILEEMIPGDSLVICEMNPRFMETLRERLEKHPHYGEHRDRIEFFQGLIQDMPESEKFDIIICSLPFLNFPVNLVEDIFGKLRRIASQGAIMSYYEYIGIRKISRSISPPKRKVRFQELDRYFTSMIERSGAQRKRVWMNVLPINIYTLPLAAPLAA